MSAMSRMSLFQCMFLASIVWISSGCAPQEKTKQQSEPDGYKIRLQRAERDDDATADEKSAVPRVLAFEISGFSPVSDRPNAESRAAAAQAAAIEALAKALVEARR